MNAKLHLLSHLSGRIFRRAIAVALLATLAPLAGCFGTFPLTKSAYRFNKDSSSNEFVQTIVFWALFIYYPLAITGDMLVLNAIEFWTLKPIDLSGQSGKTTFKSGAALNPLPGEEKLFTLESRGLGGESVRMLLSRESENEFDILNPTNRRVTARIRRAENGDALLCSADGTVLQRLPKAQ